jgi:hypothetical protein
MQRLLSDTRMLWCSLGEGATFPDDRGVPHASDTASRTRLPLARLLGGGLVTRRGVAGGSSNRGELASCSFDWGRGAAALPFVTVCFRSWLKVERRGVRAAASGSTSGGLNSSVLEVGRVGADSRMETGAPSGGGVGVAPC